VDSEREERPAARVALVTGAARGMGRAIALALAEGGAAIVAADIDAAGVAATTAAIVARGGDVIALEIDLGSRISIERLFGEAIGHYGRLDVLVNNAAVIGYASIFDLAESEWDRVLGINLKAASSAAAWQRRRCVTAITAASS
jgi:3-oxoacyl-[acyl-carrier protein] reductase